MKPACCACRQGGASLVRRVVYVHAEEVKFVDAALAAVPEALRRAREKEREAKLKERARLSSVAGVEAR